MSENKLVKMDVVSIVHNTVEEEEEVHELRNQIDAVAAIRMERVREEVTAWMHYARYTGHRVLKLDECPTLLQADHADIIEWLLGEGFAVHEPRLWGSVTIDLEKPERE